jgi:predicted  nucleic acid-binding Zn-ribbon protein
MLATIRADIRSILQSRRQQRTADLLTLVRLIARDESVDTDELLRATEISGLTDEEVYELVDLARRRIELRSLAATKPAADQELAAIDAAIAAADAVLDHAREKHARVVEPLALRRTDAANKSLSAQSASEALLHPRNLPAPIVERLAAARRTLHEATAGVSALDREIREQSKRSEDAVEILKQSGHDTAEVEKLWRDESQRHRLSGDLETLVVNMVRGSRRAAEARETLGGARAALNGAKASLDAVEREARDF